MTDGEPRDAREIAREIGLYRRRGGVNIGRLFWLMDELVNAVLAQPTREKSIEIVADTLHGSRPKSSRWKVNERAELIVDALSQSYSFRAVQTSGGVIHLARLHAPDANGTTICGRRVPRAWARVSFDAWRVPGSGRRCLLCGDKVGPYASIAP